MRLKGKLARGSATSAAVLFAAAGCQFGLQVLLARALGVDAYGRYILIIAWVSLLAVLARVGADRAALRFVAAYHAQQEWALLHGFVRISQRTVVTASLAVALLFGAVCWLLALQFGAPLVAGCSVGCLILPVLCMYQLLGATLRGLGGIALGLACEMLLQPVILFALVAVGQLAGLRLTFEVVLWLFLTAGLVTWVVAAVFVRRTMPMEARRAKPTYQYGPWFQTTGPLTLSSLAGVIFRQSGPLLIGFFLGAAQVGIYAAMTRITAAISLGLQSVTTVATPTISRLYAAGQMKQLQRFVTRAARAAFVVTLAGGIVVGVFAEQLVRLFGEEFVAAYPVLFLLAAVPLVSSAAGFVAQLMNMTGHHRVAAKTLVSSAVIGVLLGCALIPLMGLVGAALAALLTSLLWNLRLVYSVHKRLGIWSMILSMPRTNKPPRVGAVGGVLRSTD